MKLTVGHKFLPAKDSRGKVATPESERILMHLAGVGVFLLIVLLATLFLPLAHIWLQIEHTFPARIVDIIQFAGVLLMLALLFWVSFWIVRTAMTFQHARDLERTGRMTKGLILDKWTQGEKGRLIYYVRYGYLSNLNARQRINKATFHQLKCGDIVDVLYLLNTPSISRPYLGRTSK